MPPKKKAAPANAASRRRSVPESITTSRGKEFTTTAAASRPTRAAAPVDLSFPDTAPQRASNKTVAPPTVDGRKRRAPAAPDATEPPKKRGRPAKATAAPAPAPAPARAKRGPGRPPKTASTQAVSVPGMAPAAKSAGTTKKRGRPAKTAASEEPPKRRGRPPRAREPAVAPEEELPTPGERRLASLAGQTTRIDTDHGAAAGQLENKFEDSAQAPVKRGRGRPPRAKGKQAAVEANDSEAMPPPPPPAGRQYWLMKAEQDGHDEVLANGKVFNTKFTIDDLRAKTSPEPWDGVRNPTAAKNMREMKQGDLAFFYASGGKTPGIVGIMEIVREHEPDATASDPEAYGYVADAKKRDRWCVVHVEFRKKLSKPVTRAQLVAAQEQGPLAQMQEFVAARLSVSKVSEDEWEYIHTLIEGYEGENGDVGKPALNEGQGDVSSPPVLSSTEAIDRSMPTNDSDLSLVDEASLATPLASSRPVSRSSRGSAARLLAPPSRTGSRAGSVPRNLPGTGSRNRTPQSRAGSAQPPSTGGLMESIGEE